MVKHVLGVDGGGTKTLARLCSVGPDGRLCLIGVGEAPGSNPFSVGWEAAQQNLQTAIKAANPGDPADSAVLAVAGCASEEARDRLSAWANEQGFAERLQIVPDTEPVLAEVPGGKEAIGIIAGTGSVALARRADGETEIVGGWGYLLDDRGSGYAIGRDALRTVTTAEDAHPGKPSRFAQAIFAASGVEKASQLKSKFYGAGDPRAWAAALAPTVLKQASQHDEEAVMIVNDAASALMCLGVDTAKRLDGEYPLIQLAGGVIQRSAFYRAKIVERLVAAGWNRTHIVMAADAACGCAHLARRALR